MQDLEIIKLFFERSENAIKELDNVYGKLCRTISRNILKNEEDSEECVNDAYFAAWNAIPPAIPDPLSAYICKITRNLSIKKYHVNTALKRNSYYDVVIDELEDCIQAKENVESEILAKELSEYINTFLGKLDEKDRIMFVQRYWFARPVEDIAQEFGVSKNYVTVHLHRIRERLKKNLASVQW